jgi:hypothetical protein
MTQSLMNSQETLHLDTLSCFTLHDLSKEWLCLLHI